MKNVHAFQNNGKENLNRSPNDLKLPSLIVKQNKSRGISLPSDSKQQNFSLNPEFHITLAYVKKGFGKKYAGTVTDLTGKELELGVLLFSSRDGSETEILLSEVIPQDPWVDQRKYSAEQPRDRQGRFSESDEEREYREEAKKWRTDWAAKNKILAAENSDFKSLLNAL